MRNSLFAAYVYPVAAWPVTPVDEHDLGGRVRDQRGRERHTGRSCSDNEVIGLDFPHEYEGYGVTRVLATSLATAAWDAIKK